MIRILLLGFALVIAAAGGAYAQDKIVYGFACSNATLSIEYSDNTAARESI